VTGISIDVRRRPARASVRRPQPLGEAGSVPWRVSDVLSVTLVNVIGLVLIVVGWYVSHNTTEPSRHLLATNLAVGGLVIALVANVVWLISGLREVGQLRRHLLDSHAAVAAARSLLTTVAATEDEALVATPAMTRYHRPSCPAVRGKPARAASAKAHAQRGRKPCGICQPDWRAGLLVK
jgi:hypothetical protein